MKRLATVPKQDLTERSIVRVHLASLLASILVLLGLCNAILLTPAPAMAQGALSRLVQTPRLKPPPPGPRYLTQSDYRLLQRILENTKSRRWSAAAEAANRLEDPTARALGQWYYYDARDPNVDVASGTRFLDAHPGWPSLTRIQRHLEDKLTERTSDDIVYNLFRTRDPLTGNGKLQLIRVLMNRGDEDAAKIHVRDSWRNFTFTPTEEKKILANYGQYLTSDDHIARVDHLLWMRWTQSARRSFPLLPPLDRRMAETRAALYARAGNAERLYQALPTTAKQDPGVMHAAIRYYRRRDNEPRAIEIARQAPDDPAALRNPARFWDERNLLMRWALRNGRFADAYDMAHAHGLEDGLDLADAEFAAGWVALRFLGQPKRADDHFLALAAWAKSPISTARAYYWLGRSAKARGEDDLARQRYEIAAQHIYTFYGQLAAEELGGDAMAQKFVSTATMTEADIALFDKRPTARALKMIGDLNDRRSLLIFSYKLDDQLENPGEYLALADILLRENAPHLTIRAGKTAVRKQKLIPEVSYPLITVPTSASRYADPALILGLSRQESEFNPSAYSRAGARGVMQLLPSTAQLTARKERIPYSRGALLSDPHYNMTIGSAHVSHLLDRFNGSLILTLVGYNAGPHRSTRWTQDYGDPLSGAVDPIDWIELIPFSETRNYVQRVLENMQIYRARLTDGPIAGQLRSDLERGGLSGRVGTLEQATLRLAALRPQFDTERPLPPLSERTRARVQKAPALPAARSRPDHLKPAGAASATQAEQSPRQTVSQPIKTQDDIEEPQDISGSPDTSPSSSVRPEPQSNNGSLIIPSLKPPVSGSTQPVPSTAPSIPSLAPTKAAISQVTDEQAVRAANQRALEALKASEQEPATDSLAPKVTLPTVQSSNPPEQSGLGPTPFDPVTAPSTALSPSGKSPVSNSSRAIDENTKTCGQYRDFVAANLDQKADKDPADDLNSAMLAELRGGAVCATEDQSDEIDSDDSDSEDTAPATTKDTKPKKP